MSAYSSLFWPSCDRSPIGHTARCSRACCCTLSRIYRTPILKPSRRRSPRCSGWYTLEMWKQRTLLRVKLSLSSTLWRTTCPRCYRSSTMSTWRCDESSKSSACSSCTRRTSRSTLDRCSTCSSCTRRQSGSSPRVQERCQSTSSPKRCSAGSHPKRSGSTASASSRCSPTRKATQRCTAWQGRFCSSYLPRPSLSTKMNSSSC
mmetsp:Transcript_40963/g.92764  ORF Transcript_40963/g.92764 Transcript_40963/m.92764 type:complete len:204 (-) Transcript_40963:744-1355(-)